MRADGVDEGDGDGMNRRIHGDPTRDYSCEWRIWRREHNLTQQQLADAIGLSRVTIAYIETGQHPPSVTSREKLAKLQKRYREAES